MMEEIGVKRNECYYKETVADGVKVRDITIASAAEDPDKAWEMFMKIRKEMTEKGK